MKEEHKGNWLALACQDLAESLVNKEVNKKNK